MAPISLTSLWYTYITPRKNYIWFGIFVFFLVLVSVYIYYRVYLPALAAKTKYSNVPNMNEADTGELSENSSGGGSIVTVYLFSVDWCPYCKKAKPEWDIFVSNYPNGTTVNGRQIYTQYVDCTDANDPNVIKYISTYKIEGYPTVKMVKDGKTIDFDAKVTSYSLEEFVKNMTKN